MIFPLPEAPHRLPLVVAAWLVLCTGRLCAQASFPSPVITSIYPMGGEPGATVEVIFKGTDLDDPRTVLLTPVPDKPVEARPKLDGKGRPEAGRMLLTLPAEMTPGTFDLRLVGRYGVSNPRVFQVQRLRVVESPGNNVKADKALKVPLDAAIHGVFKAGVPHWFTFEAKKGRRVLAVFMGGAFDSRASLVGSAGAAGGRELARMRDGMLDFRAPEDGVFWLKVNDLMYGAGDDFGYRLSLTTGPVAWAASADTLYGWNLPEGRLLEGVKVSQGPPLERLRADAATVTRLCAASPRQPLPLPSENEPPDQAPPAGATALQVGQSWAGWFPARGALRTFDVAFKAGDRFVIEVVSQQLGYPTDPTMLVEMLTKDAAGRETLTLQADLNDPAAPAPVSAVRVTLLDPVYGHEAKADGVFRLSLSDPLNAASGRRYPYGLRISRKGESPNDLAVAMLPALPKAAAVGPYEMASANVWRQGISAVEVLIPGRTKQSDAVELKLDRLPPGVTCLGGFVGAGQSLGYVGLRADADAPNGAAQLGGVSRTAFLNWGVKDANRETVVTRITQAAPALGVVARQAPALLESAEAGVPEVAADGRREILFKLTRNSAFVSALKLKALGLVDIARAPELDIPAKGTEGRLTLDMKVLKLPPGEYGFILQGPAKMPLRRDPESLAAAEALAKQASGAQAAARKALEEARAAVRAAAPEDKAGLELKQGAEKEAAAKLALADKARTETEKAVKDLAAKDPPKEAVFVVYSNPVRIRVKEAPAK